MKRDIVVLGACVVVLMSGTTASAQSDKSASIAKNDIGLIVGVTETPAIGLQGGNSIHLNSSLALGAEYDRRLFGTHTLVYGGISFLASPLDVKVNLPAPNISPEYASLYLSPHIKLKFNADGLWQPWLVFGGGYANFSPAQPRSGTVKVTGDGSTGSLEFGGGVDTKPLVQLKGIPIIGVLPIGARFEVRDFYSGQPKYGAVSSANFQNNIAFTGGLVLRF